MNDKATPEYGWSIGQSIAIELDVAGYFARLGPDALPADLADLAEAIPTAWFEEFDSFVPADPADRKLQSVVELIARWAGVLDSGDYDIASAAMRELTPQDAISQVTTASELRPKEGLDGVDSLIELERNLAINLPKRYGVFGPADLEMAELEGHALLVAAGALRGQPLHGRFWHWMDRFYYEAYGPWRATRLDAMEKTRQRAIEALGGSEGTGPPDLGWLPTSSPINKIPSLAEAISAGEVEVIFWSEPFELSDTFALLPDAILTSFAEGGPLYQHYKDVRNDLVARLKALANPTRVSILRMIRMHDLDNTQLASHLGISRPTASVHAKVLAESGFITTSRDGRQAEHSFEPDSIMQLTDDLIRFLDVSGRASDD